jgi:hypothetical protein
MKAQFTNTEVEIIYRIIRQYLMNEEVMTHRSNDPKVFNLYKRLTLMRGYKNEKRP